MLTQGAKSVIKHSCPLSEVSSKAFIFQREEPVFFKNSSTTDGFGIIRRNYHLSRENTTGNESSVNGYAIVVLKTRAKDARLNSIVFSKSRFSIACLRLPDTFAGVLREKKYLRAVLNATTINYISVQS